GSPDRPRELGEGIGVGDANPDPMPRLRLIPASAPLPPPTCLRQVSALARAPSASPADAVFVAGWPLSLLRYRSAPSCATPQWTRGLLLVLGGTMARPERGALACESAALTRSELTLPFCSNRAYPEGVERGPCLLAAPIRGSRQRRVDAA